MSDTSMLTESYRPYRLSDIVGQEKTKKVVGAWLRTGRIPRAILICGEMSAGKTTTARIIGRSALCKDLKDGAPCGECKACKAFDEDRHPDYIEVDAASDRGIDAMRSLSLKLSMLPLYGKRKVVVLDESHAITGPAFQAMLKTLEEPPEHVVLILVTTNPEKIPNTVTSRCSKLQLAHVTVEECTELLKKIAADKNLSKAGITEKHLTKIATVTGAHPRNALHALDQVYTMVLDASEAGQTLDTALVNGFITQVAISDVETGAAAIARGVLDGKPGGAMKRAEDLRAEADILLTRICSVMRQAMMLSCAPKLLDPYYKEVFTECPIFALPDAKQTVLEAYSAFTRLRIECSNHSVPVAEVLDEAIARAAIICQRFIKTAKPKADDDKPTVKQKESSADPLSERKNGHNEAAPEEQKPKKKAALAFPE